MNGIGRSDLEGGQAELGEEVGARLVEHRGEQRDALLATELAQLEPRGSRELERFTMLAVRRSEAVLVVVRRVVELSRVEAPVVALLELDRVDAALLRRVDERLRLLEIALVVVPDLGDHVRRAAAEIRLPSTMSSARGRGDGACELERHVESRRPSSTNEPRPTSSVGFPIGRLGHARRHQAAIRSFGIRPRAHAPASPCLVRGVEYPRPRRCPVRRPQFFRKPPASERTGRCLPAPPVGTRGRR